MRNATLLLGAAMSFAATYGCYITTGDGAGNIGGNNGNGTGDGSANPSSDAGIPGDIPCDVANALASCQNCHGATLMGGAPMPLASYNDLVAQSASYPGQTEAQRSVARMTGSPSYMPPLPAAHAAQTDIDAINNWIAANYPHGSCSNPSGDGGSPYNTPSVCTSNQKGTTQDSMSMRPGEACIACHSSGEGPRYQFMGTIFPTAHEPNNCVGASSSKYSGVQITVSDAQGHSLTMAPNTAGNFCSGNQCSVVSTNGTVAMPYTVKITYNGNERDMVTPQTNGDCNVCHTETGTNSAPGRVMLP